MTFQPPPPGDTPPPPSGQPGQPGQPGAGGSSYPTGGGFQPQGGSSYPTGGGFNPQAVNPLDWGIIACGVLAFIFSFISYYTVSVGGFSDSTSAWHGFFGWFATLLALIAAGIVAAELFAPQMRMPWPYRLVALILFAVSLLCTIIALFTNAYDTDGAGAFGIKADSGHGFGYWASLIVIAAGTVLSLMRLQQTGGKLPGALGNIPNIGGQHNQPGR
jgi:hypothetical protein